MTGEGRERRRRARYGALSAALLGFVVIAVSVEPETAWIADLLKLAAAFAAFALAVTLAHAVTGRPIPWSFTRCPTQSPPRREDSRE